MEAPIHHPTIFAAGRLLVGILFLYSAASKAVSFTGTQNMMLKYRFPLVRVALPLAILWEGAGALLMIAGSHLLEAGVGLALFVLLATVMLHGQDFRHEEQRQMATIHIANNLTLIGGLIAIASA